MTTDQIERRVSFVSILAILVCVAIDSLIQKQGFKAGILAISAMRLIALYKYIR